MTKSNDQLDAKPTFKDISLRLFQNRGTLSKSRTSNTISFYDIMPKYARQGSQPYVTKDPTQTTRTYDFYFENNSYIIEVEAAKKRTEEGGTEYHFPSTKEEIIEDILRHLLAIDSKLSFFDDNVGCQFTLYLIKQELRKYAKTRSSADIRDSLTILRKSQLAVYRAETYRNGLGDPIFSGPFFADATVIDLKDWFNRSTLDADKDCKGRVKFHNMVTEGIKECNFRLIRYDICMQYKSDIARWLHKRISHRHIGADSRTPFKIKLSTVFSDGNWMWSHRMDRNKAKFNSAIKEMTKYGQLNRTQPVVYKKIKGGTSAATDYYCEIFLSDDFINHIIMANKVHGDNHVNYGEMALEYDALLKQTQSPLLSTLTEHGVEQSVAAKIIDQFSEAEINSAISYALTAKAKKEPGQQKEFRLGPYIYKTLTNKWHVSTETQPQSTDVVEITPKHLESLAKDHRVKVMAEWPNWAVGTKLTFNKHGLQSPHIRELLEISDY